jgi:hypothetical protein
MDKRKILLLGVTIIVCILITSVLLLSQSTPTKTNVPSTNFQINPPEKPSTFNAPLPGGTPSLFTIPDGYYASSPGVQFLLEATLKKVYSDTSGKIYADISFSPNQAKDPTITQKVLFFDPVSKQIGFILTKQNIPDIFPHSSANVKSLPFMMNKNANEFVKNIQPYINKRMLFLFFLSAVPPDLLKSASSEYNDFMKEEYGCNALLFALLDSGGKSPNCTPYTFEARMYSENL